MALAIMASPRTASGMQLEEFAGRLRLELKTMKADPQIWLRPSCFLDVEAIAAVRRHHLCCAPERGLSRELLAELFRRPDLSRQYMGLHPGRA
jgi:hypothetical protein